MWLQVRKYHDIWLLVKALSKDSEGNHSWLNIMVALEGSFLLTSKALDEVDHQALDVRPIEVLVGHDHQ